MLRPPGWWAERGIELGLGTPVERIDPRRRTALVRGREFAWDALVLATGARARRLPGSPPGRPHLRTLADALALRADLRPGRGSSSSAPASSAPRSPRPRSRSASTVTSSKPSGSARARRRRRGRPCSPTAIARKASTSAWAPARRLRRPARVEPPAETAIPCDAPLVAIGAEPGIGCTATPGDRDRRCGRTGSEGVYACGDVARFEGSPSSTGRALRVRRPPSPGRFSGRAAVREMPYFWSDQFGLRLQHVGMHDAGPRSSSTASRSRSARDTSIRRAERGGAAGERPARSPPPGASSRGRRNLAP